MDRFAFETDENSARVIVTVTGDVDLAAADKLWEEFDRRIVSGGDLTVDCSGVEFIDSMGLRTLIRALQKSDEVGARFRLSGRSEAVSRVLELTGVTDLFAVESAEDAQ